MSDEQTKDTGLLQLAELRGRAEQQLRTEKAGPPCDGQWLVVSKQ